MSSKIIPPFIRSPYNYDMSSASNESGILCSDLSLAVQSERDECDINTIVKRFGLTGALPSGVRPPQFGDFSDVPDYQSALNAVIQADESFAQMPADVRYRFGNDPGAFVAFCSDPSNLDEMRKLGLAVPAPATPPSEPAVQAPKAS